MDVLSPLSPPQSALSAEEREAEESGDLGQTVPLQSPARRKMFEIYSDTQYLLDNNVQLLPTHEQEDAVILQTFQASFSPPPWNKLASTFYLRYQLVRYDDFHSVETTTNVPPKRTKISNDFDALTIGGNLAFPITGHWVTYGGFAGSRYTGHDGNEFYKEFDTTVGLLYSTELGERVSFLGGYQFDWRPASPAPTTRVDNGAYLGVNVSLIQKLGAQVLYRFRCLEYIHANRTDLDYLVTGSLYYSFNQYVNVRGFATLAKNYSSDSVFDYESVNLGGGLTLSVRF